MHLQIVQILYPYLMDVADIGFSNGSIIDVQWHPMKSTLLLSVDNKNGVRIVEYDIETGQAIVVLDTEFAAYEASYSEDGKLFSFVNEQNQKNIIAMSGTLQGLNLILLNGPQ